MDLNKLKVIPRLPIPSQAEEFINRSHCLMSYFDNNNGLMIYKTHKSILPY